MREVSWIKKIITLFFYIIIFKLSRYSAVRLAHPDVYSREGRFGKCFDLKDNYSVFLNNKYKLSRYSAVRLAHLLWEQGVAGSNPATSTKGPSRQNRRDYLEIELPRQNRDYLEIESPC